MSVPSPCRNVCRMQAPTGWCEGCARTIQEIAAWGTLADDARLRVWKLLPERRARLQAALAADASHDSGPAGPVQ